jgi:benzoylformate decarboxylase
MKSGKQILNDFLDIFNIEYVFGNPGTTETTFLDVIAANKKCTYILALHESVVIGVAAGYAIKSGKTSVVNIHTYPGLANSMSNLFNAYTSGIPMLVVAGQQNRKHLIHKPILSGDLIGLASTATQVQYEVMDVSDLSIALQRCYLEATETKVPTFLSIPMELYTDVCDGGYLKPTKLISNTKATDLNDIIEQFNQHEGKNIVFVADAECLWSAKLKSALKKLITMLGCDVYLSPFSLTTVVDISTPNYMGVLPSISFEANERLSQYEMIVLLGEKIQSFLFQSKPTIPQNVTLMQFSNGNIRTRFDYPFDYVIRGDIGTNLETITGALEDRKATNPPHSTDINTNRTLLIKALDCLPRNQAIVIEGSSHQSIEEEITKALQFEEVYFEPRGGALGMAMPLAVGISLYSKKPTVCLVGDGGSMYSIHSIWTAAHYKIPVIFFCFINHEYHILKQLWKLQVPETDEKTYVGMDLTNPKLDMHGIASGFGAKVFELTLENYKEVLHEALHYNGPTFITLPDDHLYKADEKKS